MKLRIAERGSMVTSFPGQFEMKFDKQSL